MFDLSRLFRKDTPAPTSSAGADHLTDPLVDPLQSTQRWIQRGDTGGQVEQIQNQLVAAGFMTAKQQATGVGIFGPKTEGALKAFQKAKGLPDTGIFDPATSAALSLSPGVTSCIDPTLHSSTEEEVDATSEATTEEAVQHLGDVAPQTAVQRALSAAAMSWSVGSSSGQSDTSGRWFTDLTGETEAYYTAIRSWHEAMSKGEVVSSEQRTAAIERIATAFQGSTAYDAARARAVVERIAGQYGGALPALTADGVLSFLGVRRQCVEWANQLAIGAGGSYASQTQGATVDWNDARPGMGYATNDGGHYAVVVGVNRTEETVDSVIIRESNWGSGWMNPGGMVPWERTIGQRTVSSGVIKSHG